MTMSYSKDERSAAVEYLQHVMPNVLSNTTFLKSAAWFDAGALYEETANRCRFVNHSAIAAVVSWVNAQSGSNVGVVFEWRDFELALQNVLHNGAVNVQPFFYGDEVNSPPKLVVARAALLDLDGDGHSSVSANWGEVHEKLKDGDVVLKPVAGNFAGWDFIALHREGDRTSVIFMQLTIAGMTAQSGTLQLDNDRRGKFTKGCKSATLVLQQLYPVQQGKTSDGAQAQSDGAQSDGAQSDAVAAELAAMQVAVTSKAKFEVVNLPPNVDVRFVLFTSAAVTTGSNTCKTFKNLEVVSRNALAQLHITFAKEKPRKTISKDEGREEGRLNC